MFKLLEFDAFHDDFGQVLFGIDPTRPLRKQASWTVKLAEEVAAFCDSIEARDDRRYFVNVALGASETWGCFPPGSLVTMADWSEKAIDDTRIGEVVRTRDGSPQKVLSTFRKMFDGELVKLHVRGTPDCIRLTPNHKVLCIRKEQVQCIRCRPTRCTPDVARTRSICRSDFASWRSKNRSVCDYRPDMTPQWVPAEDLRAGDLLLEPRAQFTSDEAPSDSDLGRLVGLFFAEGNKSKWVYKDRDHRHYRIFLGFHENEMDSLVADVDEIAAGFGSKTITKRVGETRGVVTIFNSKLLYRAVEAFCDGGESHTKRFTPEVWRQSQPFVSQLVGGYIDGDGSTAVATERKSTRTSHGARLSVRSTSKQLLKDIRRALLAMGVSSSWFWTDDPEKYRKNGSGFANPHPWGQLECGGEAARKALAGCRKAQKRGTPTHSKRYSFFWEQYHVSPIKSIDRYRYCGPVYNLEVDGSHTYIVGGQVVANSNKNGDIFPRSALAHDCTAVKIGSVGSSHHGEYGYKTFLKAGRYKHHKNKNPEASLGKVVYAHWNPRMDRVELVSWIDTAKAPEITEQIDRFGNGDDVKLATSMGCKVPFDSCTVCLHKAATVKEYCRHLKTAMGRILPGGKIIGAINDYPFFFDDSFVLAPAAQEAGVTMKVANIGLVVPSAILALEVYGEDKESALKASAMSKEVPAEMRPMTEAEREEVDEATAAIESLMPALDATQPAISKKAMETLAQRPIDDVLRTASTLGILFTPEEFQKLALYSRGPTMAALADHYEAEGICFDPHDPRARELAAHHTPDLGAIDKIAVDVLTEVMPERSFWEPHFTDRVDRIAHDPMLTRKIAEHLCRKIVKEQEKIAIDSLEVALPLALSYYIYRQGVGANISELDRLISKYPYLAIPMLGMTSKALAYAIGEPGRVTEKTADTTSLLGRYIVPGFGPYLYSAELRRKEEQGYPLGPYESFVRAHPGTTALLGTTAAAIAAPKVHAATEAVKDLAKKYLLKKSETTEDHRDLGNGNTLGDQPKKSVLQTAGDVAGSAGKYVASGFYKARNFPGAIADELTFRLLFGNS
jgi:hypothetical protein